MPEERPRPVRSFLLKLWGPVPWMLELTFILELALGRSTQAAIIAALLLLNAGLSFVQEGRARRALALPCQRLTIRARVLRVRSWRRLSAEGLVPGDVVHIRIGDLVPADLRLVEGRVQIDQSTLTGESTPVERRPGDAAHAGSVTRRGEATGEVTATGWDTSFGKTVELVHAASAPSQLEVVTFAIVKYLVMLDPLLVATILVYGPIARIPFAELVAGRRRGRAADPRTDADLHAQQVIKIFQIALFLSLGLLVTGVFVTTPRLILLLLFTNDFVTMSLAADRVSFSHRPDHWDIRALACGSLVLTAAWLVYSFGVFFAGRDTLGLDLPRVQTLVFLMLAFSE